MLHAAEAHPRAFNWVFTNYAKRPPLAQIDEAMLEVLMNAGFDSRDALLAKGLIWRFLVGHLGLSRLPAHIDPETVDAHGYARVHEVAEISETLDAADYFTYGIDQIIASLAAARRARRATGNARAAPRA